MHSILRFSILLVFFLSPSVATAQDDTRASWDQWLDSAYQLTWHDRADIQKWIADKEATVFTMPLRKFVQAQEKIFSTQATAGSKQLVSDESAVQLGIAQLLLYLKNADTAYLDKAVQTIRFASQDGLQKQPEIAFWRYYINAHSAMEKGDSSGFVQNIFQIWLKVLLRIETEIPDLQTGADDAARHGFYRDPSYLHRNLANLILQRAILQKGLRNIDALGVVIRNLSYRMPPEGYGRWVEQVAGYMSGPDSDTFHLVFTVQLIETIRKQLTVEQLITANKPKSIIIQELDDLFSRYETLSSMAHTRHGRLIAAVKQLQLTSFVLSKLGSREPYRASISSLQPMNNDKASPAAAIRLFDELASVGNHRETLFQNGFLSEQEYISAIHGLWRAIMNSCLDTAVYYNRQIDSMSAGNLRSNIPLMEQSLNRYLEFFNRHTGSGHRSIVPDNAFYGVVETNEMLSDSYFISAQWESGLEKYGWALARRIQALDIFPFGVDGYHILARRLTEIGRLEQYRQYVAPQADRIRHSRLIQAAAIPGNEFLGDELLRLVAVLPEVIERAPYSIVLHKGLLQVPQELAGRMTSIEEKIQSLSLDTASRKHILEAIRKIRQDLDEYHPLTKEAVPAITQDIKILADRIEENQHLQPEKISDHQLPSFDSGLFADDLPQIAQELHQIKEECIILQQLPDMAALRNRLVIEEDHPLHTLLRKLYYEEPSNESGYRRLLPPSS